MLWLKSLTIYCNLVSLILWMCPDYYVDWFVIRFNDWPTLINTDSGIKATVQWVFICFYQPIASDTVKTVLLVLQNQYVGIATDPCWVKTTLNSVGLWWKTECPPPRTLFGVDVMSGRRWSLSLDIMQDFQIFETLLGSPSSKSTAIWETDLFTVFLFSFFFLWEELVLGTLAKKNRLVFQVEWILRSFSMLLLLLERRHLSWERHMHICNYLQPTLRARCDDIPLPSSDDENKRNYTTLHYCTNSRNRE